MCSCMRAYVTFRARSMHREIRIPGGCSARDSTRKGDPRPSSKICTTYNAICQY